MNNDLPNPYYYLDNFRFVLAWVQQRYADLLDQNERNFIRQFSEVSVPSQALLVRMVMRRGNMFRASKLHYQEIGDTARAARELLARGWLNIDPCLDLDQLYAVLTKNEFASAVQLSEKKETKKADLLELAKEIFTGVRRFSDWFSPADDTLYEVAVTPLCDRLRLMFFGNLYQDWSEFVLADLGIFNYEKVAFSDASRAFHARDDIDLYLQLHDCRERLHLGAALPVIERTIDTLVCSNPWLENRRAKLLFQIGQDYERLGDNRGALNIYARCHYPGARLRQIRVLEKTGQTTDAQALAESAMAAPESAEESQNLARILPRLQRKLGKKLPRARITITPERTDLVLPLPDDDACVEEVVRRHIERLADKGEPAPVYYVENSLINSLFGLLCWDAIFSPLPGAFFHPFQTGPADLHSPNFHAQRAPAFQQALAQLGTDQYRQTIRQTFKAKHGIQSPFVYWEMLNDDLLELALACLPAAHLEKWFVRLLDGIASNRSGFPDLIQFWPQQQRYQMIEVKGPGDRLQDNQIRFIDFCHQHQMPVSVCFVEWAPDHK